MKNKARKPYTRQSRTYNQHSNKAVGHCAAGTITVSCPACGASKGAPCRGRYGLAIKGFHVQRTDRLRERAA